MVQRSPYPSELVELSKELVNASKELKRFFYDLSEKKKLEREHKEAMSQLQEILNRLKMSGANATEVQFITELETLVKRGYTFETLPEYARQRLSYMMVLKEIDMSVKNFWK